VLPCLTASLIDRKWLNGEFVCRGKVFEVIPFGYGEAVCPICYDGEHPFLWWDGRFWLNRLLSRLLKYVVLFALIMLLLPNVCAQTLGSFAYADVNETIILPIEGNETIILPTPPTPTQLINLFEYINGTLATISERLNNMAKATDMNVREAAVVGEQVVLETVEQMGVRARSGLRSEG